MFSDVRALLTDPEHDWSDRRLRLRGWRGDELAAARRAGLATDIGPVVCGVGALFATATASVLLLALLAALAGIGVVAPRHPIEEVYAAWSRRTGRPVAPRNRAGTRSGCLLGGLALALAAVAILAGHPTIGRALAFGTGAVALFVAGSGICLPSVLFTTLFGPQRTSCPTLGAAWRQRSRSSSQRATSRG